MRWVAELASTDPAKPYRFAMGAGLAPPDAGYIPSGLFQWTSASAKVDVSNTGAVSQGYDAGQISVTNLPDDISLPGPIDALADMPWAGRAAVLYALPDDTWGNRIMVAQGVMEQPVADMVRGGEAQGMLRWPLRDPRAILAQPLQPVTYAGTNSGPNGVEGLTGDIKGQPKPILYGRVSNIPGVRVNASTLIYQIADRPVLVTCARDGAVSLTGGFVRASLADLIATSPAKGTFDGYSGAEGTFVRLGSQPIATITFDAEELGDLSHAGIWTRMRQDRAGTTAPVVSPEALADAAPAGFWWSDTLTLLDALNEVLASFSGFEVLTFTGAWTLRKLVMPTGTPGLELVVLAQDTVLADTMRKLQEVSRVRPNYAVNGAPPYSVEVDWGRAYTVMSAGDFNGASPPRLQDKFSQEWRSETRANAAIWDPKTKTGLWPTAAALVIQTGYQVEDGSTVSAGAAAEADRLAALYGKLRSQFTVAFVPRLGDSLIIGDVVRLTMGAMGLSGGPLFRVLQTGLTVKANRARAELVIGFSSAS